MEKNILKRVASLALAVVMVFSVLVVVDPQEVSAADDYITKTIKNASGRQPVVITDEECYGDSGYVDGYYVSYGTQKMCYIKFKAKADGYVKFSASPSTVLDNYADGTWALYTKPNVSSRVSYTDPFDTSSSSSWMKSEFFGVKKNKTYYLGVKAYTGVKITAQFTNVKESSGKNKGKAKTIGQKKTIKGTIGANSKEADWYKFKLSKTQYVKISCAAKTNSAIKFSVYEGSRNLGSISPDYKNSSKSSYITNYANRKIKCNKGTTFYVKVERQNSNASGYYTLKWSS